MSDRPSFLEELKRRKVARAAVVYAAVAWAVLQVADIVVPALSLPEKMVTGVVVLVFLGFPIALVLAWAFDMTPRGVRRTATDSGAERAGPASPHRWLSARTLALAGTLLVVGWIGGRFLHPGRGSASPGGPPSVAVLPFRDLGTTLDEAHFADGIQDDILTQLGRLGALRVTSRTSTERYRETEKDIPTIASELGVRAVLEGGVQRTPQRVHINVQLIDGVTDEHLWAETYDRELTADNVFAIQSEIARAVAEALKATLTPEDEKTLAEVPTRDLEALDLYHRGRSLMDETDDQEAQTAAIGVFQEAVRRDPSFARAWAELTRALSWQIRMGAGRDTLSARQARDRTQELAPGSVDANLAEGYYLYYARGDFEGALAALERIDAVQSNNSDLVFYRANVLRRLGRWSEATALFERTVELAPEDARALSELGWAYQTLRRFDEAWDMYQRAIRVAPEFSQPVRTEADIALWGRGDTTQARAILPSLMRVAEDDYPAVVGADLVYVQRNPAALDMAREVHLPPTSFSQYYLHPDGPVQLWRARMAWALGDTARARLAADELEPALVEAMPALAQGGAPAPEGEDLFGANASLHAIRGWALAFRGEHARALAEADSAVALYGPEEDAGDGMAMLRQRAQIRVVAGDLDGAVSDLRKLLELPGLTTVWELRLDPFYDSLRGRADFQELVAGS